MKIKLLLVLLLSLLFINYTHAEPNSDIVRVAISNKNYSNFEYQNVKLSSINIINIIDMSQNIEIIKVKANSIIDVKLIDGVYSLYVDDKLIVDKLIGPLIFSSNADIQLLELNKKGMPAKYKGLIELRISKNNPNAFNVINVIDIENYLRGVVPNEMPISFGLEAMKAQSVAARNYVTNAQISPNYDVVDTTSSQVYNGVNAYRPISDEACEKTLGIYALYKETPITALYFSTSAGITDDWDDVFGNGTKTDKYPYLKAVYDYDINPLKTEKDVIDFYSRNDNGFDTNSPKFRWKFEFDRLELEEILKTTLLQQSKVGHVYPKYDGKNKLSGLKDIKVLSRTQSGKITKLEIVANSGNYVVDNQLAIRRLIKKNNMMLPSGNFYIEPSRGKEKIDDDNETKTSIFDFSLSDRYPKSFTFVGGGFGHGVGMSQYGAYNLSKLGKKYPEILKHYYTDIKISTLAKKVYYNEHNSWYKTKFYFEPETYKKAYLYINNTRKVEEFPFKINDYQFNDTSRIASKRVVKIDITDYLKEGINTINFAPLKENNDSYIIYRVEFE